MMLTTSYTVCFVAREDDEEASAEAENNSVIMCWRVFVGQG